MDEGDDKSIVKQAVGLRVMAAVWLMILASPIGIGCAICLLAEGAGDDAVPGLFVISKYLAGPIYAALGIWLLVLWFNRRDDPIRVNPPAPNPDAASDSTRPPAP